MIFLLFFVNQMILQKQNSSDCGPIAILNAFYSLHGYFPNCNLARRMKTNDEGTEIHMMSRNGILKLGKMIFRKKKILKLKKFIIIYVLNEAFIKHYVFVERTGNEYYACNYTPDEKMFFNTILSKKKFVEEFFKYRQGYYPSYPIAWKIEK
jgi:hypothetical protein